MLCNAHMRHEFQKGEYLLAARDGLDPRLLFLCLRIIPHMSLEEHLPVYKAYVHKYICGVKSSKHNALLLKCILW